ncbi:hypothetical protein PHAVU_003G211400 [Phaseolus vulgaris]|uniref:Uncharacterized protein n=1 Tax=Phaseolus vulgaris TaxID=3885 RepID=V7CF58_PHAVU|nr:hypothetical protein PHAVU_003G211400g [Phaseolus vulgaris]ESW27546.1 hypothetical protein PHAVU_003G211400g [Phaseolus vulgaris]
MEIKTWNEINDLQRTHTRIWPEPLPTGMTSDLHARRVHLSGRALLHPLRSLYLLPRTLPHLPRTCELRLRHLHLAPRQLPHTLRVRFLHRRQPDLLRRLPLQRLHAVAHQHRRRRTHADRQLQVQRRVAAAVCGGGGGNRRAQPEERGIGARRWEKVEFSVNFVFHWRRNVLRLREKEEGNCF